MKLCERCGKEKIDNRRLCNACSVATTKKRRIREVKDYFGGKCSICEYDKCYPALEFHHKDPNTKSFSVCSKTSRSFDRLLEEAKKCLLVCANCHREIHEQMAPKLEIEYPGRRKFLQPKNCKQCGEEFQPKKSNQKYCSDNCRSFASRKVDRPSKNDLKKLISENSWCDIGRMYNVSNNAVRKWAKSYKIRV